MLLFLIQATPTTSPTPSIAPLIASSGYPDPITIATVIIAVCTVAYSVLTYFMFRTAAANTKITREIFEASHRPYVGIPEVDTDIDPINETIKFVCAMRNFGSVPAHNVEVLSGQVIVAGKPINLSSREPGIFSVFPTSYHLLHLNITHAPNLVAVLKKSKLELCISLRYEGLAQKKYEYSYHAVYEPSTGHFAPMKEQST